MSEAKRGRGRSPGDDGTGNRGGGKRPVNGKAARVKINITIDPDLSAAVDAYAAANGLGKNRSQAISDLIAKALEG